MVDLSTNSVLSHRPVLYKQIINAIQPFDGGKYVDCTVGAGGHAFGILEACSPNGKLLGLDVDPHALDLAKKKLATFGNRAVLLNVSYKHLSKTLTEEGWENVDGILIDLGVSSMQLDDPQRGFSFLRDAPLDMRFDPTGSVRAEDLVNELSENQLADLIYKYGEELHSRKIAKAIVINRPISSASQLAELIVATVGYHEHKHSKHRRHPATRTFQALRIEVNQELNSLEKVLPQTIDSLNQKGRLAIIAFHSLEDRMVKQFFQQESVDCICPPEIPVCVCSHRARLKIITRRPIRPEQYEIDNNPRARSARLRVIEKINSLAH